MRFIALDVDALIEENFEAAARKCVTDKEVEWVTKVLSDNPNRWTIIVQHQAIYAIALDRGFWLWRSMGSGCRQIKRTDACRDGLFFSR